MSRLKMGSKTPEERASFVADLAQELSRNEIGIKIEGRKIYGFSPKRGVSFSFEEIDGLSVEEVAGKYREYFNVK